MSWFSTFARSSPMMSMYAGVFSTGFYVSYKDFNRTQRMVNTYKRGIILPPISDNSFEIAYQSRHHDEEKMEKVLQKTFCNQYYIINGNVGVGKSRVIRKVVTDLINTSGKNNEGAPIYVTAEQGKTFPDTLAKAVNFHFDEHISFIRFIDIVFKIESLPHRDDKSKLTRVLDAIEESAFIYMKKYKRPVVLVIDNIYLLHQQMPSAINELQEKAKLWADCNIVKLVLVNNDENLDTVLQADSSSLSRMASPILISDFTHEEAIQFLTSYPIYQDDINQPIDESSTMLTLEEAEKIISIVGGRILDLIIFKRKHRAGVSLETIEKELVRREQEKFVHVSRAPQLWNIISKLRQMPGKKIKLSKLVKFSCKKDVETLYQCGILRYEREDIGVVVHFDSFLMENVVDHMESIYLKEKKHEAEI